MPLVRIDIYDHHSDEKISEIGDAIHEAFLEVFKVPVRDKFQIIAKHPKAELIAQDAGLGFDRDENLVMIQITTQRGRSRETKQALYESIAANLEKVGVSSNNVFISYVENSAEDWSFGFGKAQFVEGDLTAYSI